LTFLIFKNAILNAKSYTRKLMTVSVKYGVSIAKAA